jgi:hypothetical protein
MAKKFKRMGGGKRRRNTKLWIVVIAGIMLLSALSFMSYRSRPQKPEADVDTDMQVVRYTVEPVGDQSGLIEVTGELLQLVLLPKDPGSLDRDSIENVFGLNSSSISNTVLELTNAYAFFRFHVDDIEAAEKEILDNIRLTGGYNIYRMYGGRVSDISVEVVGHNLSVGDEVRVMLFQNVDNPFKVIGFAQTQQQSAVGE